MRLIQTFILRLYTDTDLQEALCGDLRILPGHANFSFKNDMELTHLLLHLSKSKTKIMPMQTLQDETKPPNPNSN
jgi:hypothetical protein